MSPKIRVVLAGAALMGGTFYAGMAVGQHEAEVSMVNRPKRVAGKVPAMTVSYTHLTQKTQIFIRRLRRFTPMIFKSVKIHG